MDFWSRLEEIRSRHNVLEHPFYQRWSEGQLTLDELAFYSGEYHHAVCGLAEAVVSTAAATEDEALLAGLTRHAAEEASHIDIWANFAEAVGFERSRLGESGRDESIECRETWGEAATRGDLMEGLVTLYAVESGQPAISDTKLDGLKRFYGLDEGPATEYFELHSELDKEHAEASRKLIEQRLTDQDAERLLAAAERAFAANWKLLDGVEKHFGRTCERC